MKPAVLATATEARFNVMISRAQAPKTGKLDLQFPSTPRGAESLELGNGEPDEPFRPSDLYACRPPGVSRFPLSLFIASKRTKSVTPPGVAVALAVAPEPMRLGKKRAHLGGAGGEPPAVLGCLLDLSNKCAAPLGREGKGVRQCIKN